MTDTSKEMLDAIAASAVPGVFGMAISFFRLARYGWHGVAHFISQSAMSVFTSIISFWMLDLADFPPTVDTDIIGLSGFYGAQILDIVWATLSHVVATAKIPGIECEPLDRDKIG